MRKKILLENLDPVEPSRSDRFQLFAQVA